MQYKHFVRRPCRIFLSRKKKWQPLTPLLLRKSHPAIRRLNVQAFRRIRPTTARRTGGRRSGRLSIVSSHLSPFGALIFYSQRPDKRPAETLPSSEGRRGRLYCKTNGGFRKPRMERDVPMTPKGYPFAAIGICRNTALQEISPPSKPFLFAR